jgi:hypothetical protein
MERQGGSLRRRRVYVEAKGRVALVVPKLQNLLWSLGYVHVVGTDLVIVRPFSYSMDFGTAY